MGWTMTIGARIVDAREKRGLTAVALAALIRLDKAQLSRWENDHAAPNADNLRALCDALDVSADYLLGRTAT